MSHTESKSVFVAYSNTDLTEGRGRDFPIAVCELKSSALRLSKGRYVQGSDGPVRAATLKIFDGEWYAPLCIVKIESPTKEDIAAQSIIDCKAAAIQKAKDLGLTDAEIAQIQRLIPQ